MTDFQVPAEAYHEVPAEIHSDGNAGGGTDDVGRDYDGLIDLVRRDLNHDGPNDAQVDRLSYDLDGEGHFDLVKEDESSSRY